MQAVTREQTWHDSSSFPARVEPTNVATVPRQCSLPNNRVCFTSSAVGPSLNEVLLIDVDVLFIGGHEWLLLARDLPPPILSQSVQDVL
jgi:hypothetical protein